MMGPVRSVAAKSLRKPARVMNVNVEQLQNGFVVRVSFDYDESVEGVFMTSLDGLQEYIVSRRAAAQLGVAAEAETPF